MLPIEKFESTKQAIECLNEWQTRLGLSDWTIKLKLCEPNDFVVNDRDGECEYISVNKCAVIRILKSKYYGDRIVKYCAERILIHELLHCKLGLIKSDCGTCNELVHQIHEDLARALICSKYRISYDWFSNITYEEGE